MAPVAEGQKTPTSLKGATDTQLATIQTDRLSVNGVAARRSKAAKFSGGVIAHTSSEFFKGPGRGKPKAKRWNHRLTEESKSRKPSSLKGLAKYLANADMISLGGGLPSSEYFPIEHIDIKVPQVPHFTEAETETLGIIQRAGKHDIADGRSIYDLHVALNYGQATGSAQVLRMVTEHTEIVHNPPYQDWQCCMSVGNTNALELAFRMFVNRGDYLLTDSYVFSSAAETARPLGAHWLGVNMDEEGMLPSHLDSILTRWDPEKRNGRSKPFLMYTVPCGHNPTGATQSLQRKKEIYRVAQKHDLYIIEDEPYYFLQMQQYTGPDTPTPSPPATHKEFLESLVPSFLSLDVDGRVMRLDSFSKVIAPGLRASWITASEQIVERFTRHSEVSAQNPSGVSQIILFKLLDENWGHGGFFDWLIHIRVQYTRRRDVLVQACEVSLPLEVASWHAPMAGMFHWIKIDWKKHPAYGTKSMLDIEEDIFQAAIRHNVLTSKGSWFRAEEGDPGDEIFFRTTFAAASEEQIKEAIKRFGDALRESFGIKA